MAKLRLDLQLTGFQQASGKLKQFGAKMQSAGASISAMSLPLAMAGGAAIKMAASFDKSMTKIKTLVGVAGDEVDNVREGVMQMAKDTGSSADEAADALFFITSAGIELDDAMVVLEKSLKASAIGLGDVATVADSATSAMNAYGSEALSAEMATDVLTNTVRLGKLSSEELAGAIGQVIPIASNLGVEFHEVGATLAAMSRTGTNAATASMQLKNILMSILKPSKEGAAQLEDLGLSSKKLREQIKEKGLLDVLTTLKEKFGENDDAQAKVFGGARALMGVMDLLGKGFKDTTEIFDGMSKSAGVTAAAYEELQNSAEFKLRKAMISVKETFRETGAVLLEALLPAIKEASRLLVIILKKFNNLSDGTKKFIGVATIIGTVLGPVLMIFGGLIASLGSIAGALGTAKIAMIAFTTAMKANPIIAVASAVIGLGAALIALGQAHKKAEIDKLTGAYSKLNEIEATNELKKVNDLLEKQKEKIKGISRTSAAYDSLDRGIEMNQEKVRLLQQHLAGIKANKDAQSQMNLEIEKMNNLLNNATTSSSDNTGDGGSNDLDIAQQTADALLTTKQKQFDAEISATIAHYDNLKKLNEGDAETQKQLEISKGEKLKQISDDHFSDILNGIKDYNNQKQSLEAQIADASAVTDEQRKNLEIQRTATFYGNLIDQAKKFGLEYGMLVDAMNLKIDELTNGMKQQTSDFATSQQLINDTLKSSFVSLGQTIGNTFSNSGTLFGAFLGTFLSTASSMVAANLATSTSSAVDGATKDSAKIPFGTFILPALIAAAVGTVGKAFSGIKKFAKGGIVSTPTMGVFGEYPGARSNPEVVAPLDKLKNMIGDRGGSSVQVGGEFTLKGQDLVVALQRANKNRNRIL